jgi:neutral ceramidase
MTMLRVDRCDDGWSNCRPKGAYTVFAIHPTGYPAANRLLDGDILAIPERTLETRIEQDNRVRTNEPTSGGFHLFANGTEGDVAPRHFPGSRCEETLRQESGFGPAGPPRPANPESWRSPPDRERECLEIARRSVNSIGDALAERAVTLFERIEKRGALSRDLRISRAFATYKLPGLGDEDTLCPEPRSGLAQVVGSTEDAGTRMIRWRFLGLVPSGMEEGGRAEDRSPSGCHQEKRILLGRLQGRFVGQYSFPEYAQLAVVRLGNTLLATLPWEVTTTVGWRMKEAIAEAGPQDVSRVVVVSVTNGYMSYLTTAEEYSAQHYEGGSNLYGPNTAAVLTQKLAELAVSLNTTAPIVEVNPMHVSPGSERRYFATSDRGRLPKARVFKSVECDMGGLRATWIDADPGPLLPADGSILSVEERLSAPGGLRVVAVDDHRSIEVRALRRSGDGHLWEVRWLPDEVPRGAHRVVLNDGGRRGEIFPRLASEWVECGATSG